MLIIIYFIGSLTAPPPGLEKKAIIFGSYIFNFVQIEITCICVPFFLMNLYITHCYIFWTRIYNNALVDKRWSIAMSSLDL